jgi:DNA-binding NtrC family response regulator
MLMTKFMTLLVEDDALQREAMADLLKFEGLEVIECSTAEAAELIVATSGAELLALVTDNALDGRMSGAELAVYARQKFPDMNIIVMSGNRKPNLPANTHFLQKPFPPAILLNAVRKG